MQGCEFLENCLDLPVYGSNNDTAKWLAEDTRKYVFEREGKYAESKQSQVGYETMEAAHIGAGRRDGQKFEEYHKRLTF
jgi:hypothetical protein